MPVRCLSIHAGYQCRRSGACCSGVFAIPAEPQVVELIRTRGIPTAEPAADPFLERNDTVYLGSRADGACAFYEADNGASCGIQRRAGEDALPSACRHFPRLFLRDGRGLSVTLSHFCPTAASMLLEDTPLAIVTAGPPLELDGDVEPFEADGALPPLVRPDLLANLEGFDAWERATVATLAHDELSSHEALDIIESATEMVRAWQSDGAPLAQHVRACFAAASDQRRGTGAGEWGGFDRAVKRYLAAKVFASRLPYECRGLRSMVAWLRLCLERLRRELSEAGGGGISESSFVAAVRAADLALVHRTDVRALAGELSSIETKRGRLS